MGEIVGFTATRKMDEDDALVVWGIVQSLPADAMVVVGACVGGDALIARAAYLSGRHVHAVVPFNRSQVDPEWECWCDSYETMGEGTDYRGRNEVIVKQSGRMIVIAQFDEAHHESIRSGTWMTKRISEKAGKPTEIYILRKDEW